MNAPGECQQVDSLLTGWCFTTAAACWSFSLHDRVTGGALVRKEYHKWSVHRRSCASYSSLGGSACEKGNKQPHLHGTSSSSIRNGMQVMHQM
jgi:hypothetical protein